jgi:imidazolonepropionase-like amidohydrolase
MPARLPIHLRGVVLPEDRTRDVFVVDGRITFESPPDWTTLLGDGYLLPGLVDTHAHLALASPASPDAPSHERVRASARAQLAAGVLALREPGGPDHASIGLGPHEGLPRVQTAGRFLAPPGGYFPGVAREATDAELADAAGEEGQASRAWVKVIGDWFRPDGVLGVNYSTAALRAAVARAHAIGARVAVHAATAATVEAAIDAGVDSIEHGIGLRDAHVTAMAARRIALVPTLTILPDVETMVAADADAQAGLRRHTEMTRRAAEAGVLILAGTDAGMGPHGMVRQEIAHLLQAGLPAEMALSAGSWAARSYLGLTGIEEGGLADLVAYPDDPRGNPAVLARPELIVLDGRVWRVRQGVLTEAAPGGE